MHTVTILVNDQTFRVTFRELLPYLHHKGVIVPDATAKIEEIVSLLKCMNGTELVKFLTLDLKKKIDPAESYRVVYIAEQYSSVDSYEEEVLKQHPGLAEVEVKYREDGSISNLHNLPKLRLEVELAKRGYTYNYSTVKNAAAALRKIANCRDSPSPDFLSAWTRSQNKEDQNLLAPSPKVSFAGKFIDYKDYAAVRCRLDGLTVSGNPDFNPSTSSVSQVDDSGFHSILRNPNRDRDSEADLLTSEIEENSEAAAEISKSLRPKTVLGPPSTPSQEQLPRELPDGNDHPVVDPVNNLVPPVDPEN